MEIPGRLGTRMYGVMCGHDATGFEYMCAVEVESLTGLPEGTGRMRVPPQRYAVFADPGPSLRSAWQGVFAWLAEGPYDSAHTPDFEVYAPDQDPMAGAPSEIWVGVVARSEALERSWDANAPAWTRAVREGRIESRRAATDAAIVWAALQCSPRRVLDVGCGEGWLARRLAEDGVAVVGVDASAPLVQAARAAGGGRFEVRTYRELAEDPEWLGETFDAAVFNFSLLDEEVAPVLRAVRRVLAPDGTLLLQTVHPWQAAAGAPYRDGWRTERFTGMDTGFTEPMPWYFRTLQSWVALLHGSGYRLRELSEPLHPATGQPLSLLLVGTPRV